MSVPAAVDALQSVWRSALDAASLTDVQLFDGPDASRQTAGKSVTVAAAFEDDQDAVTITLEESGAGPSVVEVIDVACSIYAGSGEVDVQQHRLDAGAIYLALDSSLRVNRTLNGTVNSARISSMSWLQGRDTKGAGVAVGLVVSMRRLP